MDREMVTKGSTVIFGNECSNLRHRRSASSSSNCLPIPARPCAKCQTHSTLFSRSRSENQYKSMCADCGLSQKQKAMRRWKTLAIIFVTITKTTSEEDVNELAKSSVSDKSKSGSQLGDHIVHITPAAVATATREIQDSHLIIAEATIVKTGSWVYLKFLLRVINMLIEVCQATMTQENGQKKLRNPLYWRVSVITCSVCLVISVVEFFGDVRHSRAVWQTRGSCCWFYYPGTQGQMFGNFPLCFGVVSSGIQFVLNLITVVIMKKSVTFEPWPLLFSIGHLFVAKEELVVKCRFHGCALQCPQCVS